MKFGLNITTYDRVDYCKTFFESIKNTIFPPHTVIHITDDCSKNTEVHDIIQKFISDCNETTIKFYINDANLGSKENYKKSLLSFLDVDVDFIVNVDSDCLVNERWLLELNDIITHFGKEIICSSFYCENHLGNPNNKITIIDVENKKYIERDTLNGLGICFHKDLLYDFLSYNSEKHFDSFINYDLKKKYNLKCICTSISYMQHIGEYGVHSRPEFYDKSNSFID